MRYLRLFDSHNDYESANIEEEVCVVYDGEEVHYIAEEPTDTTTIVE